jgi:hypothetical protein
MIPRADPETRRTAIAVQVLQRSRTDQYGHETRQARRGLRYRPLQTRNGLPEPGYVYRGTGKSMKPDEALWWLAGRRRTG